MRILQLSSEKNWRGGEQQIAYLIEELINVNVEVFVVCRKNSAFEKYCIDHLIEHITLPFSNNFDFNTAWQIRDFCKEFNIQLIHAHSSQSHTLAVIAHILGAKIPIILHRRVDFFPSGNFLSNFKYNYKAIRKIICVSKKIKEVLTSTVNDKNKLTVIYSGIDFDRFNQPKQNILHQEYKLPLETYIVANISAIAPHKDYFTFVDTVVEFKKYNLNNVKFFIIGEGECKAEIEKYIVKKRVSDDIILTGFRNDIPKILPEINVFLITSKEEGLGTTVLDAFANKVPVVATSGGGIPEMIQHKETGLLYPIQDAKSLAKGINLLLTDKILANRLTENAYQLVHKKFSKKEMAKQIINIYKNTF